MRDAKWMQTILKESKLYTGSIDGLVGPKTIQAMIDYIGGSVIISTPATPIIPVIERKLDFAIGMLRAVIKQERTDNMATVETLARLQEQVTANTNAAQAAALALRGFVQTVIDLTQALQDAIAGGDEVAIKAAADAIEANNATLVEATHAIEALGATRRTLRVVLGRSVGPDLLARSVVQRSHLFPRSPPGVLSLWSS